MSKKLLFGMFVLGLVAIPAAGAVYASEEAKPWENLKQFRGGYVESAKSEGLDKEDFFAWRDAAREAHRETRLDERMSRLKASGCLDSEGVEKRMQKRGWRFTN